MRRTIRCRAPVLSEVAIINHVIHSVHAISDDRTPATSGAAATLIVELDRLKIILRREKSAEHSWHVVLMAERLFGVLPEVQAEELRALREEFEAGDTAEARFLGRDRSIATAAAESPSRGRHLAQARDHPHADPAADGSDPEDAPEL